MTTDLMNNPLPERRVRFVSPANRVRMLSGASYEDEEEDGEEQNIEVRVLFFFSVFFLRTKFVLLVYESISLRNGI